MVNPHHLVFDAGGMIRSLRYPKRFGFAQVVISTGRWPDGASLCGTDALAIARYLKPDIPKQRAHALRLHSKRMAAA